MPRVLVRSVFTPVCNDEVKVVYELEELLAAVIRWFCPFVFCPWRHLAMRGIFAAVPDKVLVCVREVGV